MTTLVVAAHPDDEVLGCGGTMCRHIDQGENVHLIIMTEGITSRHFGEDSDLEVERLRTACEQANFCLGTTSIKNHKHPDNRMDSIDLINIVKGIEAEIDRVRPTIVYTHHGGDLNIDHQVTFQAVMTATRPTPMSSIDQILCFEIPSSTDWQFLPTSSQFVPTQFVDISVALDRKRSALRAYESELRPWPHSRSIRAIEHLCHSRGASVGLEAAEAFSVARLLVR